MILRREKNGGKLSRDFYNGYDDFTDGEEEKIRDLIANDYDTQSEWEGDDDIYDNSAYSDDDWINHFKGEHDFSRPNYDLKGAMKKRGLAERKLNESIKRITRKNLRRHLH